MRKTIVALTLILMLLITATAGAGLIYAASSGYIPESGSRTATIKADGSVYPESAPILQNGSIYSITADIEGYIVLERSNCVLDGAGHAVEGVYGPIPVQVGSQWQVDGVAGVSVMNMVVNGGGIIFYGWLKSNNLVIANNTLNNGTGIDCSGTGNIIANNTITGGRGIGCGGDGNTVSGNHLAGCDQWNNPTPYGISVAGSRNIIFGNIIAGTKGNAIDFTVGASKNVVAGNQIIGNQVGVHTTYMMSHGGAEGTIIYNNNFVGNNRNVYNEAVVTTAVSVNAWDNGKEGNFWSDYSGNDAKGDGIGDIAYTIDSSNLDHYPLMAPVDISKLKIESLTSAPLPTPTPTTTPIPTSTPTPTPTPNPTTTSSPSSIPQEPKLQPESKSYLTTPFFAVLVTAFIVLGAGLLIYLRKRKS